MKRSFMHFAYAPFEETLSDYDIMVDECTNDIIDSITEATNSPEKHCEIMMEIPDDLSEEEALSFIDDVMRKVKDHLKSQNKDSDA